jgi:hypothetical protein
MPCYFPGGGRGAILGGVLRTDGRECEATNSFVFSHRVVTEDDMHSSQRQIVTSVCIDRSKFCLMAVALRLRTTEGGGRNCR